MALRPALEDANSRKQNPVKEQKCQVIGSLPSIREIKPTTTDKTFSLRRSYNLLLCKLLLTRAQLAKLCR